MQDIHYRLARRPVRGWPGQHRSRAPGPGLDVQAFAPLSQHADARRLDIHVSARDPFSRWIVRLPRQRSGITLVVLADLSASMAFGGGLPADPPKQQVAADLLDALGHSAWRAGDALAFAGAAATPLADWTLMPTRRRGASALMAQRVREATLTGRGCGGMAQAALEHGRRRDSLVFVVSDFHWPQRDLDALCEALASRDVVPVVCWSTSEFDGWPQRGLAELQDLESGERRTVLFTPALAGRMSLQGRERRAALRRRFGACGWRPYFLAGKFDAAGLNGYFHGDDCE